MSYRVVMRIYTNKTLGCRHAIMPSWYHTMMSSCCHNPSPGVFVSSGHMRVGGDMTLCARCGGGGAQQLCAARPGGVCSSGLPLWGNSSRNLRRVSGAYLLRAIDLTGSHTVRGHRPAWGPTPFPRVHKFQAPCL